MSYLWQTYIQTHPITRGRPNSEPATSLPEPLAALWIAAAEARDRLPILTYASFNLYNWRRIDPEQPVSACFFKLDVKWWLLNRCMFG